MSYRKPSGPRNKGLYDTPTDGVSRKVFDRYKDQQVRHRAQLLERIRVLERHILKGSDKEEE